MNSTSTFRETEASLVDSGSKSEIGAQVLWVVALIGTLPFVLVPIQTGLSRIESLPVYAFDLSAWVAAFVVFALVVRSRWNRLWHFPRTRTSLILAIAGIVCQVCALYLSSVQAAALGWVLLSGAWLSTHAEEKQNWNLLSHLPALCMLVPPHFTATKLNLAYEQLLSHSVSLSLDSLGVPFRRDHSQFEFASFAMSVGESLIYAPFICWMLFVSCVVFSWLRRPIVLLPAYLGAALLWAFGMHLVQLCTIAYVRQTYGMDVSSGWQLVLLNMTTLLVALGLMFSTDRCLRILFMPVPIEDSSNQCLNPISHAWNRMLLPLATDNYGKA